MTRLLLSLNQAVDTLFAAIRTAKRGETYVPIVSASTVLNIAKALIGKRKIEIKITGIRPAEKLHEIMVSQEDAVHCVRRGNYYAILPMLPELRSKGKKEPNALKNEFSSENTALDLAGTIAMLKKNRLMIEDVDLSNGGELLR
jgi:UDP-glucose 4-epimerase